MKKRRIGTLEAEALKAGLPRKVARNVHAMWTGPLSAGLSNPFITVQETNREHELYQELMLDWLIAVAQDGAAYRPEMFQRFQWFIQSKFDGDKYPLPSPRAALNFVRKSVREFVQMLDTFDGRMEVPIGKVTAILSRVPGPLSYKTDWKNAFLMQAVELLDEHGKRIRRCALQTCRRLFLGDFRDHQRFCSLLCGTRFRDAKRRSKMTPAEYSEYRRQGREKRKVDQAKRAQHQKLLRESLAQSPEPPPA